MEDFGGICLLDLLILVFDWVIVVNWVVGPLWLFGIVHWSDWEKNELGYMRFHILLHNLNLVSNCWNAIFNVVSDN